MAHNRGQFRNKQSKERGVPAPQAYYMYVEDAGFTLRRSYAPFMGCLK